MLLSFVIIRQQDFARNMLHGELRPKFDFSFQVLNSLLDVGLHYNPRSHALSQRAKVSSSQFRIDIRGNRKGSLPRLTAAVSLEQAKENPASRTTASVSWVYEPCG